MVSTGRIFCVAFPFVATLAAFATLLVATLGGKNIRGVYMFEVNLTRLSIDPRSIGDLLGDLGANLTGIATDELEDVQNNLPQSLEDLNVARAAREEADRLNFVRRQSVISDILGGGNITAADLGLYNVYLVNLWGTCSGDSHDDTTCSEPRWDWASQMLNESFLENIGAAMGANVTLPREVSDGLRAFNTSMKWLQIVFAVALGLLGLEVILGLFTGCSRIMSCLAYVAAGVATTITVAASIFATVVVVTVVGILKGAGQIYGLDAAFNTNFLALIWIAVALAVVASLFWCISICCCSPERRHGRRGTAHEKDYNAGSYQPLGNQRGSVAYGPAPAPASFPAPAHNQSAQPYQTGSYEPYSHQHV